MSDTKQDILRSVSNGISTTKDLSDHLGLNRGHVNKVLLELVEEGDVVRRRAGNSYEYFTPEIAPDDVLSEGGASSGESDSGSAATMADHLESVAADAAAQVDPDEFGVFADGQRVDLGLDYDAAVPEPTEYIPTDGEYDEILAEIELREAIGKPFHGRLVGHTGTAKTTLVEAMAASMDWPLFTVQATYALNDADIIGHATGVKTDENQDVPFEYGPVARALASSAERPTVLLVDEVNRAPARAKGALFRALDHRATLEIGFTGETIRGNPMNLILFSTMNAGTAYQTDKLDLAEARRLGGEWEIEYLGLGTPTREVALVMTRAPINRDLAEDMVDAANYIREDVSSNSDSPYKVPLPTPNVIDWARAAAAYQARDLDDPVVRAMRRQVLPIYKTVGGNAAAEVESFLTQKFRGREVEPPVGDVPDGDEALTNIGADDEDDEADADDDALDKDADQFGCTSCGHVADADEVENAGYVCPDCGEDSIVSV